MKPLLIIKTGRTVTCVPPDCGDFEHWIATAMGRTLADCIVAHVYEGEKLPASDSFSGVVITGSAAMVTERLDWSEETAAWLRSAHEDGLPILGICYGHQLLAHALGGLVGFHPQGREIGTVAVCKHDTEADDMLLAGLPSTFKAQVSHMQTVIELPKGSKVLAYNDFEVHQAVRFGPSAWGVQFHPEFSAEVMRAYLEARCEDLLGEGYSLDILHEDIVETLEAKLVLKNFAAIL